MNKKIIGVSGNQGSYSEAAAKQYIKQQELDAKLSYLLDMDTVLLHLAQNKIDLGIFPVMNNNAGIVTQAFEAMGKYEFTLIDHSSLQIDHCLMTLKSLDAEQIMEIVSHPQALVQCKQYINKNFPNAKLTPWIDTAEAAKNLEEGKISAKAAIIAPKAAADLYGLKIQQENIQDSNPNVTSFIVVENRYKKCFKNLDELRENINELDKKLILLLAERNGLSYEVGKYKKNNQLAIIDEKRERELLEFHKNLAAENGLDKHYSAEIFKLILMESKRVQKQ